MITATLPPFAQPGTHLDVTAAAIGDAANLQGGILLLTPLKAADGQVYAVAQGPVVTGGFAAGRGGTSQTVNHPTVAACPTAPSWSARRPRSTPKGVVRLQLRYADFTTASRIAAARQRPVYGAPGRRCAAENSALVSVAIPPSYATRAIDFIAELEKLTVDADRPARVVVNERTGTIVMGREVRISPVAILHGNLTVEIQTSLEVSQPAPLSPGETTVVPKTTSMPRNSRPQRGAQAGRHGRGTGARAGRHRLHAARRNRHPAEPARCRRAGSRNGGDLMGAPMESASLAPVAAGRQPGPGRRTWPKRPSNSRPC